MRRKFVSTVLCVSLLCISFESFAFPGDRSENARRSISKTRKYKKLKKQRKYRQWRAARARMLRQRAARQRRLRARCILPPARRVVPAPRITEAALPSFPFAGEVPASWKRVSASANEVTYSVDEGRATAVLSVMGNASGETVDLGRHRTIGGVPTTTLRRGVIDRMVREQGWVVNDYQREMGGRSVYVVVAQSPAKDGSIQSRNYYFTESDGHIYNLATTSPVDGLDRIAADTEKVIQSLKPSSYQQASKHD
jgi:hypothetical protein